jgi:hypothetical protein
MPKLGKNMEKTSAHETLAAAEYKRLIDLYESAAVDATKLKINDKLIRKVAELYATLEGMKVLPTIVFDKKNLGRSEETPAGKARVKYMAQYSNSMYKLNKDLLSAGGGGDDDGLGDFEDEVE